MLCYAFLEFISTDHVSWRGEGGRLKKSKLDTCVEWWIFEYLYFKDPTELGTHSSTLKCLKCKEPTLYPGWGKLEIL